MRSRAAKWAVDLSPVVQGTAAATVAWLIADYFVGNTDPFFAPIAAVIALNAPLGERGLNAFRVLAGVIVGIAAGEAATFALGGGTAARRRRSTNPTTYLCDRNWSKDRMRTARTPTDN